MGFPPHPTPYPLHPVLDAAQILLSHLPTCPPAHLRLCWSINRTWYYNAVFEGDGFFPSLYKQFDEWQATPEEYLDADDNVIAVGVYRGRVIANQVRVESPFEHIWTVRNGRLARMRQFTDTAAFVQAMTGGASTTNTLEVL